MSPDELLQPEPTQPTTEQSFDVTDHALEVLDGMSEQRMELLVGRTLRRIGVESPEQADGDQFAEAFSEELKMMIVNDSMQRLQTAGLVQVSGIGDSGELLYELTEQGKRLSAEQK